MRKKDEYNTPYYYDFSHFNKNSTNCIVGT